MTEGLSHTSLFLLPFSPFATQQSLSLAFARQLPLHKGAFFIKSPCTTFCAISVYRHILVSTTRLSRGFQLTKRENESGNPIRSLFLLVVPKDDFFLLERCFHIDDALVGRSAETQGDILERFDVSSVYQNVDEREHFVGDVASGVASFFPKLLVQGKARKAPNGLVGTLLAEAMQKGNEGGLVLGLKRLTAQ